MAGSQLPQRLTLIQTQQRWAAILNPVIGNPMSNPGLLTGISVVTGQNVINHLLGQIQQGWIITDIDSNITLYRSAVFNDKTLTLTASGPATISLAVF